MARPQLKPNSKPFAQQTTELAAKITAAGEQGRDLEKKLRALINDKTTAARLGAIRKKHL